MTCVKMYPAQENRNISSSAHILLYTNIPEIIYTSVFRYYNTAVVYSSLLAFLKESIDNGDYTAVVYSSMLAFFKEPIDNGDYTTTAAATTPYLPKTTKVYLKVR